VKRKVNIYFYFATASRSYVVSTGGPIYDVTDKRKMFIYPFKSSRHNTQATFNILIRISNTA
jgi:hypothetical protein